MVTGRAVYYKNVGIYNSLHRMQPNLYWENKNYKTQLGRKCMIQQISYV